MKQCPFCIKEFKSYKSWHRHKTLSHSDKLQSATQRNDIYMINPKVCQYCSVSLSYEQRHQIFCSQSCSASYNNQFNKQEKAETKRKTWRTKLGTLKKDRPRSSTAKLILKTCPTCSAEFTSRGGGHTYCTSACNLTKTGKVQYRTQCKFKLNPKDHQDLYRFDLITTNGWYRPTNSKKGSFNPDGVTWDHLYRIEEGYTNRVDPSIMNHPANAEMVTWRENQKRRTSQITLDELKQRIDNWPQCVNAT